MRALVSGIILLILSVILFSFPYSYAEEAHQADKGYELMLKAIRERGRDLDIREKRIRAEEEKVIALKTDVIKNIQNLKNARERFEKILYAMRHEQKKGMKNLAKMFESMPVEEAAARIVLLDNDLAIRLMKTIKKKKAGQILAQIAPEKAAKLTRELDKSLTIKYVSRSIR